MIEPSLRQLKKLCVKRTIEALLAFWYAPKFPNTGELKVIGWSRLYVKKNKYLILSNICLEEELIGNKVLTGVVRLLRQHNIPLCIECPSPMLLKWCIRNNIPVLR